MERTGEENENKIKNLENKYMPGNMDVEGHYRDIRTGDKELEEIEDKEQEAMKRKVRIYGCVEVQEPAIKLLKIHPKLALWHKLDMTTIMTVVEKWGVKRRWAEMSKKESEEEEETIIVDGESEGTEWEDATGAKHRMTAVRGRLVDDESEPSSHQQKRHNPRPTRSTARTIPTTF